MSWDGTVMRKWFGATPIQPDAGIEVQFECGHKQVFHDIRISDIFQYREWPCDVCSELSRARIKARRDSINFNDVIGKLKELS